MALNAPPSHRIKRNIQYLAFKSENKKSSLKLSKELCWDE